MELLTADFSVDELKDFGIELPEEKEESESGEVEEYEAKYILHIECKTEEELTKTYEELKEKYVCKPLIL